VTAMTIPDRGVPGRKDIPLEDVPEAVLDVYRLKARIKGRSLEDELAEFFKREFELAADARLTVELLGRTPSQLER
jgi:hypothetical protein